MSEVNRETHVTVEPHRQLIHTSHDHPVVATRQVDPRELAGLPRIPHRRVPRPEIARRLDRLAAVTIVEALPGFGKTTVVAEWAGTQMSLGARVLWVRAAPDLDEVSGLLHRLRQALRDSTTLRQVPTPRRPAGEADRPRRLAASVEPVIVVIDDAHLLPDATAAHALMDLASRAHPIHLVICADTRHHFHTAAARTGLETNVIRAADLSVTAAEVPAYATAWGHHVDGTAAGALHAQVGGWLLPLRLVLDATPAGYQPLATHAADAFLLDQVLPDLTDARELALAMRLAVPDALDIHLATVLANSVAEVEGVEVDGRSVAATLEHLGLLWRMPHKNGIPQWRFPQLVRRALLDQFERDQPEAARSAHRDVAQALARSRGDRDAGALLRHARSASDWALLAELWDQRGWSLVGADPGAFEYAYRDLPAAAKQEFGSLVLAGSLGDALATIAEDLDWMHRVEVLLRHYMRAGVDFLHRPPKNRSPAQMADVLTSAMIARRSEGKLPEADRLAEEAARDFARARALEPGRLRTSQEAWFNLQYAITKLARGHYDSALEAATAAYQLEPNKLVGAGSAGLLAAMHASSGQADDTRRWLSAHDSVDISGRWAAPLARLPAHVARAMLALDALDQEAAELEVGATILGPESTGLWPFVLTIHTRHALVFGDPVAMLARIDQLGRVLARQLRHRDCFARQVFDRCSIDLVLALGEVNRVQTRLGGGHDVPPWLAAPAARFHLMTGDAKQAVRIASAGTWHPDVHVRDRLQLAVTKTSALRALGKSESSLREFRRAHGLATDTGILSPLLLFTPGVRAELLDSTGLPDPVPVARLDAAPRIFPNHVELIQLSPRELEVLRHALNHETVAGLARSLSVSVNTVKKQLVSLYAKLGVHDRSAALLRAESLGFLDRPVEEPDTPKVASTS